MSRSAQFTKQAGVTQHWTYLARAQGIPEEDAQLAHRSIQRAEGILSKALPEYKQGVSDLDNSIQMDSLHRQVELGYEPLLSALKHVQGELAESKLSIPILEKFVASITQSWSTLVRLKATQDRNDWNSYRGDVKVGRRASEKYAQLLGKVVQALAKGQQVLAKIPIAQDGDYGFTDDEWKVVKQKTAAILARAIRAGIELTGGEVEGSPRPEITDKEILFNGLEEGGEDFYLVKRPRSERRFYCRTQQHPYEPVVIAVLNAVKKTFPQVLDIHVTDDGRF